jgi:tyrosine-protein phosphatase non-receptor type 23
MQSASIYFSWKDSYSNMPCSVPDIRFELMCILHNIGALHTQLGAADSRTSPDGLKMACTHFQCAAWAFQTMKETYYEMVPYMSSIEIVHFMQQVCFAQAQECILEKSMMDNRKATITAKVAVQVVDHYKRALMLLTFGDDESSFNNLVGSKTVKEWSKYLSFKVSYHKSIALLFQGQQAEEQQKMGERVAFYQAACEQLEEARKLSSGLKQQKDLNEAIGFTSDVVEGKRKAAKNENEFIYHEEVPDKHALQEVKGASLVKGIAFNVNDVEVSGPDIFARLVPMEAHEASSLYSEKKAQKLRQLGELVESKDQGLAEFMSSLQLEVFNQMRQATGLSQDLVDRAAALSAKPTATQDLVAAMGKLSNSYHEVESMLNEIQELLKEEEHNEKEYQELMGKRPPSIIATDLAREAAKYREAHNKANDSNQNLHKAMMTHVANLKILAQPLMELQKQIPSVDLPNPNVDENCIRDVENLIAKVEEMRNQRAMLWTQFREAVHKDDITSVLVTRQADQPLEQLFQQELQKHQELTNLIEQNVAAQENILKAFVDAYARSMSTRRYLQDVINKRNATVNALITSFDTYEDLVAKANKGIDFYNKLETNVAKLLQRIRSASKVQQEEREQMLLKNSVPVPTTKEEVSAPAVNAAPKLKDYLDTRKKSTRGYQEVSPQYYPPGMPEAQTWPPAVRPAPLGSEVNNDPVVAKPQEQTFDKNLSDRMATLRTGPTYSSYTPDTYPAQYNYSNTPSPNPSNINKQAFTITTDTYHPISSITQNSQYPSESPSVYTGQQYPYSMDYTSTPSSTSLGSYSQSSLAGYSQVSQSGGYGQVGQPAGSYEPAGYNQAGYGQMNQSTGSYGQGGQPVGSYGQVGQPGANYGQAGQPAGAYPVGQPVGGYNAASQPAGSYPASQPAGSYPVSQPTASYGQVSQPGDQASQPTGNYNQASQPAGSYNQASQPAGSYNQASQPAGSYNQANQPNYQVNQAASLGSYNQATQASYGQVNQPNPENYNQQNVYYPSGYGPETGQISNEQTYSYPNSFGGSEYATSVHPDTATLNQNSTYSAPIPDLKSSDSNTNNYVMSNGQGYPGYDTNRQYQYYYGANYPQNQDYQSYASGYGYVSQQTSDTSIAATTKESNIDLLTGLDFTVNQAPLIPQQNPSVPDAKKPVQKSETPKPVKIVQSKEEVSAPKMEKVINRKPLNNSDVKKLFGQEIDKFEKFVDVLTNKTLSGPTNLDLKWKEIQDKQEGEKKAISVARCYPMKNRYPDILPYDYSRIELKGAKDDYINASYIKVIFILYFKMAPAVKNQN